MRMGLRYSAKDAQKTPYPLLQLPCPPLFGYFVISLNVKYSHSCDLVLLLKPKICRRIDFFRDNQNAIFYSSDL